MPNGASAHLNLRDWHRRTLREDDLRNIPNRKERALALDSADPMATVLAWGIGPRWAVKRCADRVEGFFIRQSRAYHKDLLAAKWVRSSEGHTGGLFRSQVE